MTLNRYNDTFWVKLELIAHNLHLTIGFYKIWRKRDYKNEMKNHEKYEKNYFLIKTRN